jgi:hypothetical protein
VWCVGKGGYEFGEVFKPDREISSFQAQSTLGAHRSAMLHQAVISAQAGRACKDYWRGTAVMQSRVPWTSTNGIPAKARLWPAAAFPKR